MNCKSCGKKFHYCTNCDPILACQAGYCFACFDDLPLLERLRASLKWGYADSETVEVIAEIERQAAEIGELRNVIVNCWLNGEDTSVMTADMSPEMQTVFYDVIGENLYPEPTEDTEEGNDGR